MRHQMAGRQFSRTSSHREAMFCNMVSSLIMHERIETTTPKAKELKRLADRTITWGTSVADLTAKGRDKLNAEEKARIVHAMRMAGRTVRSDEALSKLFSDVAPRFRGRTGGYTRLLHTRIRRGDAAPMAFVELVVGPAAPEPVVEATDEKKGAKKGAKGKATEAKAEAAAPKAAKKEKAPKGEKAEKAEKKSDKKK